eukprot:366316-Chlamydomonas_euryale.AAC.1
MCLRRTPATQWQQQRRPEWQRRCPEANTAVAAARRRREAAACALSMHACFPCMHACMHALRMPSKHAPHACP